MNPIEMAELLETTYDGCVYAFSPADVLNAAGMLRAQAETINRLAADNTRLRTAFDKVSDLMLQMGRNSTHVYMLCGGSEINTGREPGGEAK